MLTEYLTSPWKNDQYREIKSARAIVVWLSNQDLDGNDFGEANLDTPRGLLQYLKLQKMRYPSCYALLCRFGAVQLLLKCYVIVFCTRGASFEVKIVKEINFRIITNIHRYACFNIVPYTYYTLFYPCNL